MALLETDSGYPGNGWTNGGEGPTGYLYYLGENNGNIGSQRAMPEGTVYAEFDFFWDGTGGDRWVRLGIAAPRGVAWDPGGWSVAIKPDGTISSGGWLTGGTFVLGVDESFSLGPRHSPAEQATVGIGVSGDDMFVYADGVLVYQITGASPPLGTWVTAAAYNADGSHIGEVRFYDALPEIEEFPANDAAQIHADLNVGVGTPDRSANLQADLNLGIGSGVRWASVHADVNAKDFGVGAGVQWASIHADVNATVPFVPDPSGLIQADLNVTILFIATSEAVLQADVNAVEDNLATELDNLAPVGTGRVPVGAIIFEEAYGIVDEEDNQLVDQDGNTLIWS